MDNPEYEMIPSPTCPNCMIFIEPDKCDKDCLTESEDSIYYCQHTTVTTFPCTYHENEKEN